MKNPIVIKAFLVLSVTGFILNGCKKEETIKPITTTTVLPVNSSATIDSSNIFKGYLGNELVTYTGHIISMNAYVNPDSIEDATHDHDHDTDGHDHDAYYMSGTKWVTITGTSGLTITNASIELRSLAVRVFVSPIVSVSSNYYNLITTSSYALSDYNGGGKGAFISLVDKNGTLWVSTGNQSGSTLTVTSRGTNMGSYTVVTGTISAKMYDPQGHMKQLTGATFTAALGI